MSRCLARYHSELTRLPGEDGIEHGPRYRTSLAAAGTGTGTAGVGAGGGGEVGRDVNQKRKGPASQRERQKEWSWQRTGQGCKPGMRVPE